MLSPGELQRLAVARVLHRRPALAVLDEVTSAVSEQAAAQLYGQLHAEGVTCLSIGQDCQHLRRLHRALLRLGGGAASGSWTDL
jgi:putative ATP-binding cassette transporter